MSEPVLPRLGRYVLPTNQAEDFVNVGALWVRESLPGGLVHGRQRIGKSTTLAVFHAKISALFQGTVGSVLAIVRPESLASPKYFWGGLLKSMNIAVPDRKSAEYRCDMFIGHIVEAAACTPSNKVTILIDEASLLNETAWLGLLGVDNTIRQTYGVDATWIFVGQPELANMPSLMLGLGRGEIVGRFMVDTYEFRELDELDDFRRALAGFDNLKDQANGEVLSRRAHPVRYDAGWRFRNDAEVIYAGVQRAREDEKLPPRDGMTMQGFVRVASHLIVETIPELKVDEPLTIPHVLDAISATNCMMWERHDELLKSPAVPPRSRRM